MKTNKYKIMANAQCAIGVHNGLITQHTKEDIHAHTLVCFDRETNYVKTCTEGDIPWGIAQQDASTSHPLVSVHPLSNCGQTACIKVEDNVRAGQYLCLGRDGKAKALPQGKGKHLILGIALTDGLPNGCIEALTNLPYSLETKENGSN